MATLKRRKDNDRLVSLIEVWTKTMRLVVKKHVVESSPDRENALSLDDFLDNNKQLVNKALAGLAVQIRKKLNRPTNIEEWDVVLVCQILLEVVLYRNAVIQQQYPGLESDVKDMQKIRNDICHSGSSEIEEELYRINFQKIHRMIKDGLTYVNDENLTKEINTSVEDVATLEMETTEALKVFTWLQSDTERKDILCSLTEGKYDKDLKANIARMRMTDDDELSLDTDDLTDFGKEEQQYLSVGEYFMARNQKEKLEHRCIDLETKKRVFDLLGRSEGIVNTITQQNALVEMEMKERLPNFTDQVRCHIKYTEDKRNLVVVGGRCSGKKSLINLLLGTPILPVGKTRSPVGIIKIQKGELTVKPQNGIAKRPENQKIAENPSQAASFIRETVSSCTSTETLVNWPFDSDLLQDDVTIVVKSGESDDCSALLEYISKSTAFIYVFDCGRADGIETNGVKSLLDQQQSYCEDRKLKQLEAKRTIFLLNKCDDTSVEFSEEWRDSLDEIKRLMVDIDPEHIIKTSVLKETVLPLSQAGIVINPHNDTERVRSIIYTLFDEGTAAIMKWMEQLVCVIREIRTKVETQWRLTEDKIEKCQTSDTFGDKFRQVHSMSSSLERDIQNCMCGHSTNLSEKIANHIRTRSVREEMHNWSYSEFPCSLFDGKEVIKRTTTKKVLDRLTPKIQRGMQPEFAIFVKNLREDILSKTADIIQILEDLKADVERFAISVDDTFELDLKSYSKWSSNLDEIINEGMFLRMFNSNILFGLLILSLPFEFLAALIDERVCRSPHTIIMVKTADAIIKKLDSKQLSNIIMNQLEDSKPEIKEFALIRVPETLRTLSNKHCMLKDKILSENRSKLESYMKFRACVDPFCFEFDVANSNTK